MFFKSLWFLSLALVLSCIDIIFGNLLEIVISLTIARSAVMFYLLYFATELLTNKPSQGKALLGDKGVE